jgi:DNA uptake protein ComE-like DNA-binding protein
MKQRLFSLLLAIVAAIDINTATVEQLKTLPGIRDAKAAAIVKNRPYLNKAQLLSRKVLSAAEYRQIRELIIARQQTR